MKSLARPCPTGSAPPLLAPPSLSHSSATRRVFSRCDSSQRFARRRPARSPSDCSHRSWWQPFYGRAIGRSASRNDRLLRQRLPAICSRLVLKCESAHAVLCRGDNLSRRQPRDGLLPPPVRSTGAGPGKLHVTGSAPNTVAYPQAPSTRPPRGSRWPGHPGRRLHLQAPAGLIGHPVRPGRSPAHGSWKYGPVTHSPSGVPNWTAPARNSYRTIVLPDNEDHGHRSEKDELGREQGRAWRFGCADCPRTSSLSPLIGGERGLSGWGLAFLVWGL